MKTSKVATATARRIFRLCLENGKMNEERLSGVIKRFATEKPRDFRGILHELRRLVRAELAKKQVTVESAAALADGEKDNITNSLRKKHGDDLNFEYKVTPDLLGGLRIQVGDNVFDSSVKSRLDRLANAL